MKTQLVTLLAPLALALATAQTAHAQTNAFAYQGRLMDGGAPATGIYDFQFYLRDALTAGNPVGTTNTLVPVGVTNGLFSVTLNFGNAPFATGAPRWLEVAVRTNDGGASSYLVLVPRQPVLSVPYALTASNLTGTLPGSQLSGTYSSAVALNNAGNSFSGNGGGLTGLNATSISSGTVADARLSPNVALLDHTQTFTGTNSFGNVNINALSALSFGASTRQMLNLYGTAYGVGVQPYTHYFRTDAGASFAWYESGVYTNLFQNPGPGGSRLLTLSSFGGLNLETSAAVFNGVGADDVSGFIRLNTTATNSYYFRARSREVGLTNMSTVFVVRGDGRVGIGTASPQSRFHSLAGPGDGNAIQGSCSDSVGSAVFGNHTAQGFGVAGTSSGAGVGVYGANFDPAGFAGYFNGRMFVAEAITCGTSSLSRDQNGAIELGDSTAANGAPYLDFHKGVGQSQDFNVRLINEADGELALYGNFRATGRASVCGLNILGGCDLAEPFEISERELPQGSLVIIDEDSAGKLKLAGQEYDTRVAGIISGANGINPGISLQQEGVVNGGQNVALSGRVYALADASYGAIKPGDLLTSSGTPGHVMKVSDHQRAQGAIVGKAMSGLKTGKGMVLVLVSLE